MQTLRSDDILRWRTAGSLALKPDGTTVAWVEMWCDGDANANRTAIFLAPTDGSAPARRITHGPNGDGNPMWSPDGRKLAFVSAREKEWRRDLYVLDMDAGGDAQLVAKLPRGVADYAWSADGARFALIGRPPYPDDAHRPTEDDGERRARYAERVVHVERLHYRGDGAGIVDDEQPAVWVVDSSGGEPKMIVDPDYPISSVSWTADGRIAFSSRREPDYEITWNDQVWVVSPDGGEPERVSDTSGPVGGFAFTDGGSLVCTATRGYGLPVGCYDDDLLVDNKKIEIERNVGKHVLADTVDPVARSGMTPRVAGDDVYFLTSEHGTVAIWRLRDGVVSEVVGGVRVIGEFEVAGDVIVFTSTSTTEPASIRVCALDGSDERVLHDPNPWMADITYGEVKEMWVTVDGVRSQAWVILPAGGAGHLAPAAVLSLHGGPHGAYGVGFNLLLQMLGGPERSVIFGNPPGSLTYGEAFTQLTHRAWGEADLPHMLAFCDEAVAQGWADPDRLGVTGGSYGGFLTLWAISHTDRFKAALSARGVADLGSIFASSEFGWTLMYGCFGAHPWEDPDLYKRLSPLTYADQITTPLRLIGCTADHRVSLEQVEQMYIRLKVMGRDVDMVVFRDSHYLIYSGKPWYKVDHMQTMVDWFDARL